MTPAGRFGFGVAMPSYVDPEPCPVTGPDETGASGVLSDEQVNRWRSEGYALVDGVIASDLVHRLQTAAFEHFPAPGTDDAERMSDFGSASAPGAPMVFPSKVAAFNEMTLNPRLLAAVAQLLGVSVDGLRLTQSDLWPKYGRSDRSGGANDNQDQRIHVDYPNHMLVHPTPWDRPAAVELIIYLSDHADTGGSTAVVPRTGPGDPAYRWPIVDSPGIGDLEWVNDRGSAEDYLAARRPDVAPWRQELYEREQHTRFRPGTILFYRHDTWHRGTPLRSGAQRLAHNLTFRRADCEWINTLHTGWSWAMYRRGQPMERLIAEATVDQRTVLGFPAPGSSYWCAETVSAVGARFGPLGMDMAPYEAGLAD